MATKRNRAKIEIRNMDSQLKGVKGKQRRKKKEDRERRRSEEGRKRETAKW